MVSDVQRLGLLLSDRRELGDASIVSLPPDVCDHGADCTLPDCEYGGWDGMLYERWPEHDLVGAWHDAVGLVTYYRMTEGEWDTLTRGEWVHVDA